VTNALVEQPALLSSRAEVRAGSSGKLSAEHFQASSLATIGVVLFAAIKSRLVIRHFMDVRFAPAWLLWTCDGWLAFVIAMVFAFYYVRA
jgi:hypothetical protein